MFFLLATNKHLKYSDFHIYIIVLYCSTILGEAN